MPVSSRMACYQLGANTRSKLQGIKFVAQHSYGVFGLRSISVDAKRVVSLSASVVAEHRNKK